MEIDNSIYYVLTYNRDTDDYSAEPRRGSYNEWTRKLDARPASDPVADDAPTFNGGIFGRWRGRAAMHLRRQVGAYVQVWMKEAHPVTGEPRYYGLS